LLGDELAADPVPSRQIADRCRSRQRLNGQVPPVSFRQQRRGANASIHLAPTNLEKSGCYHLPWQRQLGCACDPDLNHAAECRDQLAAETGVRVNPWTIGRALRRLDWT
jgi:hypothetical protein